MTAFFLRADDVLRGSPWTVQPRDSLRTLLHFLAFITVFGTFYGAVMGSYAGFSGDRLLQVLYSAVKVPLLLLVTFLLALPSFFVLNTLLGVRDDFPQVLRALLAAQAALTIILASLAPLTALWYLSWEPYNAAILFNAVMFGIASLGAQWLLRRYYRPLIQRNRNHRILLRIWLVLFAFVGIQMGWVLRPFIGHPRGPTQFFRPGAWGNAYVELVQIVLRVFSGQ